MTKQCDRCYNYVHIYTHTHTYIYGPKRASWEEGMTFICGGSQSFELEYIESSIKRWYSVLRKKGWHGDERTWRRQPWWEKEDMQNHRGQEALDLLEKKNVYRGQNLDWQREWLKGMRNRTKSWGTVLLKVTIFLQTVVSQGKMCRRCILFVFGCTGCHSGS